MKENFKSKINKVVSSAPSRWVEQARYRKDNPWLTYSRDIAARVFAAIHEKPDMNQTRLAEMLNVSPQQVSKIIKGEENMTLETIYKLSTALGVELISFPEYAYSKPIGSMSFQMSENRQEAKVIHMDKLIPLQTTATPYSVNVK